MTYVDIKPKVKKKKKNDTRAMNKGTNGACVG